MSPVQSITYKAHEWNTEFFFNIIEHRAASLSQCDVYVAIVSVAHLLYTRYIGSTVSRAVIYPLV